MDVEAHLLPVPLQLEQTAFETTMRISTTPLHADITICGSNEKVPSPLDQFSSMLKRKYNIQLDQL